MKVRTTKDIKFDVMVNKINGWVYAFLVVVSLIHGLITMKATSWIVFFMSLIFVVAFAILNEHNRTILEMRRLLK